jgi:hypothetical protein
LVDRERKGRGVQEYIDRMILSSVIDLQRYVPQLRQNQYTLHSPETLVEPLVSQLSEAGIPNSTASLQNEDVDVHQGSFNFGKARIKQVVIRRVATTDNNQKRSRYFYPKQMPWQGRYDLIDGGIVEREDGRPGRVSFGPNAFWTAPKLRNDEGIYIYYEGESHYTPIFKATDDEKATPVVFDEMVAKASSSFVKAHLAREVDNDLAQYESYYKMYQKDRAQVFINEKEYTNNTPSSNEEFLDRYDHDGTVIPDAYDNYTTAIVSTAAEIEADELTADANFISGLQGSDAAAYALILTASSGGAVSFDGTSNVFPEGVTVDISATPNTGYVFQNWVGLGVDTPTSANTTVVMEDNRYVRAQFVEDGG